jgi:hypothetical protein
MPLKKLHYFKLYSKLFVCAIYKIVINFSFVFRRKSRLSVSTLWPRIVKVAVGQERNRGRRPGRNPQGKKPTFFLAKKGLLKVLTLFPKLLDIHFTIKCIEVIIKLYILVIKTSVLLYFTNYTNDKCDRRSKSTKVFCLIIK